MTMQATEPTATAIVPETDEDSQAQTAPSATMAEGQAAAAASGEAGESGAGAATQEAQFDFDSPEGLTHALDHPALKAKLDEERKKAQDDGFNAGRQKRDKELRLERGNEDVARAWRDQLAAKYGVELDESDQREAPLWVQANRDRERAEYWHTMTNQVLDAFDARERAQIEQHLESFDGLADQMEQLGRQVIDEAVKRQSSTRLSALTLADIPEGSALHASVQQHISEEVAKELEAREAEAKVQNAPKPPRTPVGATATTKTQADYASLTPAQIAELSEDEYRVAMGYPAAVTT